MKRTMAILVGVLMLFAFSVNWASAQTVNVLNMNSDAEVTVIPDKERFRDPIFLVIENEWEEFYNARTGEWHYDWYGHILSGGMPVVINIPRTDFDCLYINSETNDYQEAIFYATGKNPSNKAKKKHYGALGQKKIKKVEKKITKAEEKSNKKNPLEFEARVRNGKPKTTKFCFNEQPICIIDEFCDNETGEENWENCPEDCPEPEEDMCKLNDLIDISQDTTEITVAPGYGVHGPSLSDRTPENNPWIDHTLTNNKLIVSCDPGQLFRFSIYKKDTNPRPYEDPLESCGKEYPENVEEFILDDPDSRAFYIQF